MDAVGIDLATALLDLALNRAPRSDFAGLAQRLPRLGGSHAQRDVFVRTLAEFAANRGDSDALAAILEVRRRMRHACRHSAGRKNAYRSRRDEMSTALSATMPSAKPLFPPLTGDIAHLGAERLRDQSCL